MAKTVGLGKLGGAGFLAFHGAILFGCAGRRDLPMFWAYLVVWGVGFLVAMLVVDPSLIRERIRPGPGGKRLEAGTFRLPAATGGHLELRHAELAMLLGGIDPADSRRRVRFSLPRPDPVSTGPVGS